MTEAPAAPNAEEPAEIVGNRNDAEPQGPHTAGTDLVAKNDAFMPPPPVDPEKPRKRSPEQTPLKKRIC